MGAEEKREIMNMEQRKWKKKKIIFFKVCVKTYEHYL